MAQQAKGWLLVSNASADLEVIQFPTLARTTVQLDDRPWSIGGPDRSGRIVYIVDVWGGHQLRVTDVLGSRDAVLFERPGDPLTDSVIGGVACSASGRVAFWARDLDKAHLHSGLPDTPRRLEVLDLDTRECRVVPFELHNARFMWMPDQRRLLLYARYDRAQYGPITPDPRVTLLDVDTGVESDPIGTGELAFVEPDGIHIWVGVSGNPEWLRINSSNMTTETRSIRWLFPIASIGADLVVAAANPTEGLDPKYYRTLTKAPQAMWSVKLFDTKADEFLTVEESVARHHTYSWGSD
ncbi:MAG: hypothetical protein JNL28_01290 [Planctomycetes bacterium]|nr:hypothetical protein [Planctomycetota bacterium]